MKLLIITQKVDEQDSILGFFHRWIEEFAKHCEKVTVICLYEGKHNLPKNVKVLSLGKEKYIRKRCDLEGGACDGKRSSLEENIFSKITYTYRFYRYIWSERKNYDSVFVHMNPIYAVLGGIFWRLLGKKIVLWYTHKNVDLKLRIAEKFTHNILTASKESFRLKSNKVKIMGHGIDTEKFKPVNENKKQLDFIRIVTVGRISPVKDYETLVSAVQATVQENILVHVEVIGDVGTPEQKEYLHNIKTIIKEKKLENRFSFIGSIPNKELPQYLERADVFINMSHTGSLDKAILEAMAVKLLILTCNEALLGVLGEYSDILVFTKGDFDELAQKISFVQNMDEQKKEEITKRLRNIVIEKHNIEKLMIKIVDILK